MVELSFSQTRRVFSAAHATLQIEYALRELNSIEVYEFNSNEKYRFWMLELSSCKLIAILHTAYLILQRN